MSNGPIRPVRLSSSLRRAFRLLARGLDCGSVIEGEPYENRLDSKRIYRGNLRYRESKFPLLWKGHTVSRRTVSLPERSAGFFKLPRDISSAHDEMSSFRERWNVCASNIARRTHNPIRSIVENIVVEPNPNKPMIALSIGESTSKNLSFAPNIYLSF